MEVPLQLDVVQGSAMFMVCHTKRSQTGTMEVLWVELP